MTKAGLIAYLEQQWGDLAAVPDWDPSKTDDATIRMHVDKWFMKSDQNGDGYLDLSEVKPYLASMYKSEFGIEKIGTEAIMDAFQDMDQDGD